MGRAELQQTLTWEPPWVPLGSLQPLKHGPAGMLSLSLGCGLLHSWVPPPVATCLKSILVQHLSPWIKSPRGHERARALGLAACLLQFFLEHLHVSVSTGLQTSPLPSSAPLLGNTCAPHVPVQPVGRGPAVDRTALDSAQGKPATPRRVVFRSSLLSHLALTGAGYVNQNFFSGTTVDFYIIFLSPIRIIMGFLS